MTFRISTHMAARLLAATLVLPGLVSVALAQSSAVSGGVNNASAPKSVAAADAKAAVTQTQVPTAATLTPRASNQVGDATSNLLALQAQGQYASRNAYPVTSDVAQRTYQRYLESFTHKIPENADTQVGNKAGGGR